MPDRHLRWTRSEVGAVGGETRYRGWHALCGSRRAAITAFGAPSSLYTAEAAATPFSSAKVESPITREHPGSALGYRFQMALGIECAGWDQGCNFVGGWPEPSKSVHASATAAKRGAIIASTPCLLPRRAGCSRGTGGGDDGDGGGERPGGGGGGERPHPSIGSLSGLSSYLVIELSHHVPAVPASGPSP